MGFFDKIQETITTATDQTKAKAQEAQLKRDRKNKLEALGEQVYNMYLNGQLPDEQFAVACREIAQVDQNIAAAQAQAARQQPQPQAGAPGAPVAAPPTAPQAGAAPQPPAAAPQQQAPPPPAPPPPQPPAQASPPTQPEE